MPSIRQQRVSSEIAKIMNKLIRNDLRSADENFDDLFNLIDFSITKVIIDPAFTLAQVMFTTFVNDSADLEEYLASAKSFLRQLLAREMKVKRVPDLMFKYDYTEAQMFIINANLESQKSDL